MIYVHGPNINYPFCILYNDIRFNQIGGGVESCRADSFMYCSMDGSFITFPLFTQKAFSGWNVFVAALHNNNQLMVLGFYVRKSLLLFFIYLCEILLRKRKNDR